MSKRKILITGIAGNIGEIILRHLPKDYDIRGLDKVAVEGYDTVVADLSNLDDILSAFEGIDTVVHLAADPNHQGSWDSNLKNNIIGTRNVYEAARLNNVDRVIFASSNHTVGYKPLSDDPYKHIYEGNYERIRHPIDPISVTEIRPDGYYGVSKAFGESLGSYFHDEYGVSVICIRIGWVMGSDDPSFSPAALSLWMSHRDTAQIIHQCIEAAPSVGYALVYGMSNNTYGIWDMAPGRNIINYIPQDNAGTIWTQSQGLPIYMSSGDPQRKGPESAQAWSESGESKDLEV